MDSLRPPFEDRKIQDRAWTWADFQIKQAMTWLLTEHGINVYVTWPDDYGLEKE